MAGFLGNVRKSLAQPDDDARNTAIPHEQVRPDANHQHGNVDRTARKECGKVIGIAGPPTPAFASAAGLNAVLRLVFWALSAKVRRAAKRRSVTYDFLYMHASGEQLAQLAALVDAGVIRPVVGASIPFTELPHALGRVGSDGTRGKTVMIMTS